MVDIQVHAAATAGGQGDPVGDRLEPELAIVRGDDIADGQQGCHAAAGGNAHEHRRPGRFEAAARRVRGHDAGGDQAGHEDAGQRSTARDAMRKALHWLLLCHGPGGDGPVVSGRDSASARGSGLARPWCLRAPVSASAWCPGAPRIVMAWRFARPRPARTCGGSRLSAPLPMDATATKRCHHPSRSRLLGISML